MNLGAALAVVPILIAINAFFVAAEYAIVAARPAVIEVLRQRASRRTASAFESLASEPASAIATIQICITMANLLIGWIAEPAMSALLELILTPVIRTAPHVLVG